VIPASAVVARRPTHGLDIAPAEPYIQALDDASLPDATLRWESTDRARIDAVTAPGQVVSVQITYDPGWVAWSGGRRLNVRQDGLGMMVIDPVGVGPCRIALEFTGGLQRMVLQVISLIMIAGLCLWGLSGLPIFFMRRP
jgi:uncharacterized membrane protein YfhO